MDTVILGMTDLKESRIAAESGDRRRGRRRADRTRPGQARFGWASLSDTERVVADLAARGRTNRQMGAALFVSPHTVDSHIRHIYAKLGISSRVELTRVVLVHADDNSTPARHAVATASVSTP
jgi:DNA-binding CsgD family transcriptional regulator